MKEKISNGITEVVFVIDRSGSMSGLESDTIGGFNSNIERQRKMEGKTYISTVLFDNYTEVIHDRVDLEDIRPMTEEDYFTRGSTALLDAIGGAIHHIANIYRYARPEDIPEKTLFIIITDGMENASQDYSYQDVKSMIETEQNEYGWEFIFIGANIDAVTEGARLGIRKDRAVRYKCDKAGTHKAYDAMGFVMQSLRSRRTVDNDWLFEIQKDVEERGE